MRVQFVLSEMITGLRRNLVMTIALVITVAVSLGMVGAALLVRQQVGTMKDYWYDKVEVSIFLKRGVSQDQRSQLLEQLNRRPEVKEVFYESQAEAHIRFKEQFKDSPALVDNVTADALPESFRVKLHDPEQFDVIASEFSTRPGVDSVLNQRELLDQFFTVLNGFRNFAIFLAIVMLLAAVLLVSNTVRVAAFSRRRETGIMRLVGASNLYIQLPFLLEGALAGLIGGVAAVAGLSLVKSLFVDNVLRPAFKFTAFIGWGDVIDVIPWLLLLGVGLSAAASFLTLRKYLRV